MKITLLQSAGICWAIIGATTQNPPLVRSCRANVGPTTIYTSTVETLVLGQGQHANNDVLPTTPTITQRWSNVCLLSEEFVIGGK